MDVNFIVVAKRDRLWLKNLRRGLEPLGSLQIAEGEDDVIFNIRHQSFAAIIVDEHEVDDVPRLIKRIRDIQTDARIVIISEEPSWRNARNVLLAGATDYIKTTIGPNDFGAIFSSFLKTPDNSAGPLA